MTTALARRLVTACWGVREITAEGLFGVREWWWRHVSQRALSRLLDTARIHRPPESQEYLDEALERVAARIACARCEGHDPPP
ncbi:hypothetical protein [Streptomyces albireticuli]|uniref:hypothetical protein n=1 Tax=Streptomyces albireticuli TaxID=1940 RepID=UPI00117DA7B4|nr:hypothetical protein [Streptomyces albireticuli]MCD9144757.1 hypothetical protein [Streptomyces albireticuli]MCD9165505.1 hypothetical protein [Streptomyces albireticuli]MCD9193664.1 hypothetical protein [Streptomyces albireticuli]